MDLQEVPKSKGLFLIGETHKFAYDPINFIKTKVDELSEEKKERCPIFQTNILGKDVIIITSDQLRGELLCGKQWRDFSHKTGHDYLLEATFGENMILSDDLDYLRLCYELLGSVLSNESIEHYFQLGAPLIREHMEGLFQKVKGNSSIYQFELYSFAKTVRFV